MSAPIASIGMGCADCKCDMKPMRFLRRPLGDHDVQIEMKYCGVCHSDLHHAHNDMGGTTYPAVPGHELAGVCVAVGAAVTKFKVGDHVGVGCFVDSCLECSQCASGDEQYCRKGAVFTYGSKDKYGRATPGEPGLPTYGGYCTQMVVHERFGVKIPADYPLEKAGPLLCAAITMWDPLKHWGAKEGTRVGIVGLGGLGQMGVKLAKALGCHVTVISRSEAKRGFAEQLQADRYVATAVPEQLAAAARSLDLILNTISAEHEVMTYLPLLDVSGNLVQLGLNMKPHSVPQTALMFGRTGVNGSIIGGIRATQEVVDFCAEHKIYPETEVRPVSDLNWIYEKLHEGNDTGLRYVLDIANTLNDAAFEACKDVPPPKFE